MDANDGSLSKELAKNNTTEDIIEQLSPIDSIQDLEDDEAGNDITVNTYPISKEQDSAYKNVRPLSAEELFGEGTNFLHDWIRRAREKIDKPAKTCMAISDYINLAEDKELLPMLF